VETDDDPIEEKEEVIDISEEKDEEDPQEVPLIVFPEEERPRATTKEERSIEEAIALCSEIEKAIQEAKNCFNH
jgi:hypothetical protein